MKPYPVPLARTLLALLLVAACSTPGRHRQRDRLERERRASAGLQAAEAFWDDLSHARIDELAAHYAPEVRVRASSEALKPEWGLAKERGRDAVVERDALVDVYRRMIGKIGAERWTQIFASLPAEGRGVTLEERDGRLVVCVLVEAGEGDDRFLFWLRESPDGWRVFEEEADY